jgi:G3E family GTPase
MVHTSYGQVDPSVLFPPALRDLRTRRRVAGAEPRSHRHDAFQSYELAVEAGVQPEALIERLRNLGMLRGKGFVRTSEGVRLVQGVGRRIELAELPFSPPGELIGRVVIITRQPETGTSHDSSVEVSGR